MRFFKQLFLGLFNICAQILLIYLFCSSLKFSLKIYEYMIITEF
jgi:hypothetical protein